MRYAVRNREWLQFAMHHPGRGTPFTVRSLAQAVGLSHHSTIGHLLSGRQVDCDPAIAHAIAEAVGVAVLVLFAPPPSPNQTVSAPESHTLPKEP
ncbi:hypothetical protein CK936_19055 [Streptomyces albireticuli]|uniref:HTH cro/C1-type domain-containing protein n=1 Tax=Streptomyces albireticuli TaxID=1940 RepID=A0A2A2D799_9ACTN|nr:hypothetical protein CK936_19055 [Streptomyces albireticuli]